jgi:hypothetical protein
MEASKMKKIFIVTGESSGDILASKVIDNLKKLNPNIKYLSVGGENLKKLGIKSIYDLKEITYLGFTNVIMNIFKFSPPTDRYFIFGFNFFKLSITFEANISPEDSPVTMNIFFIFEASILILGLLREIFFQYFFEFLYLLFCR